MKKLCALLLVLMLLTATMMISGCSRTSDKPADTTLVDSSTPADGNADTTDTSEPDTNPTDNSPAPAEGDTDTVVDISTFTTFAEKSQLMYKGHVINVGDKLDDVTSRLGSPAAPAAVVPSCLTQKTVTETYYPYLTIQSVDGVIFNIEISDNGYTGEQKPTTVMGIGLGDTGEKAVSVYGDELLDTSGYEITGNPTYIDGSRWLEIYCENGAIFSLQLVNNTYLN